MNTSRKINITLFIFFPIIVFFLSAFYPNEIINTKFKCPVDSGKISLKFGNQIHPILKKERHHDGIDIKLPIGSPVYSILRGKVIFAGYKGGFGKSITIKHENGIETSYSHLNEIKVSENQDINKSDKIGTVGNSGLSIGPHLHFEYRQNEKPLDPLLFIDSSNLTF